MSIEWTLGILSTIFIGLISAIYAKHTKLRRTVDTHAVTLGKIPAEVKVAVLEAMATQEHKFTEIRGDIAEVKTEIGILKNRRDR